MRHTGKLASSHVYNIYIYISFLQNKNTEIKVTKLLLMYY